MGARKEGVFRDLSDFVSRIDTQKVNKKVIESLIKAGALDSFGYSRKAMLQQIEEIIDASKKADEAKKMAEHSLFGGGEEMTSVTLELKQTEEYDTLEVLEMEKEALGFYVSGHPLDKYRETLEKIDYTLSSQIDELADGSQALFIGKIEEIVEKISKKGNKFGIAHVIDLHGTIELMLFEDHLKMLETEFDLNRPIAFKVRISKNGEFTRFTILKIETLQEAKKEKVKVKKEVRHTPEPDRPPLILAVDLMPDSRIVEELLCLVERHPGNRPLQLRIKSKLADVVIESKYRVSDLIVEEARELGVYVDETN